MRLPNEQGVEFLLLQPMVPTGRPNMIAWVAARMDAPNYGQVQVYRFPADTTIFGPAQIEARIDQDPTISAQVSLWNQSGSKVIRGSLIVVPLDNSLIYLQPVYLQSTGSAFPEFKRIVVASPRQVVWSDSLGDALRLLLAAEASGAPSPPPSPSPGPTPDAGADAEPDARARWQPDDGPDAARERPLPTDVPGLIDYANPISSSPRRRCATATSPATARRSRWSRPPSSDCRSSPRNSRPEPRTVRQPRAVNPGLALIGALLVTLDPAGHLAAGAGRVPDPRRHRPDRAARSSCCRRRSGIGDVVGPSLGSIALGGVAGRVDHRSAVVALVALLVWLFGGGWLAAALEAEGARIVASATTTSRRPRRPERAGRRRSPAEVGPRPGSSSSG